VDLMIFSASWAPRVSPGMANIETLADAFDAKWGVRMRCGLSEELLSRGQRCGLVQRRAAE